MTRERDITDYIKQNEMELKSLDFKVGQTYHAYTVGGNGIYKIHIEAIIPSLNDDYNMIVYRYYGKHKQRWFYIIKEDWWVTQDIEWAKEKEEQTKYKNNEQN